MGCRVQQGSAECDWRVLLEVKSDAHVQLLMLHFVVPVWQQPPVPQVLHLLHAHARSHDTHFSCLVAWAWQFVQW